MLEKVKQHLINSRGWSTNRKIVVFESDDWGSIRMPNKRVYSVLSKLDSGIEKNPYCKYDTLASVDDLNQLFSVLLSFKDKNDQHPIITANTVVSNPMFDKIRHSSFNEYSNEPFTETLRSYYPNQKNFDLWQQGKSLGIFYPQFHGREHVNAVHWLKGLKVNALMKKAFDYNCWGLPQSTYFSDVGLNLQATYDAKNISEVSHHEKSLKNGLELFNELFGYSSKSFIPNNFIFDKSRLTNILVVEGVTVLQGMKYHKNPLFQKHDHSLTRRSIGKSSKFVELVRNVTFEPSQELNNVDIVGKVMQEISTAFFWSKPAIITCHRLNFIGTLDEKNRTRNLKYLEVLLKKVLKKWPDVEFMNSVQLANLID